MSEVDSVWGVGNIIGWVVIVCVGAGVDSYDEITFGLDDEYKMGSSVGSFDNLKNGKPVGSLLD